MAKAIMIQGTASNSGKTFLTAGLCRLFKQDGYKVAPFKSQNMALNSYVTADGFEIGRAQAMQAEAAGTPPDVRMNPILLKPTSDQGSEVIVHGTSRGIMSAKKYFAHKKALLPEVEQAYESLAKEHDIIVIEGAGSPVEINLKAEDIVNMGMASLAKAPVLIVGDIDRGGVFASLTGTVLLLTEEERRFVKGVIINKFRGDLDILRPGLVSLADIIQQPILGVVPHVEVTIDDEDSLSSGFCQPLMEGNLDIAVIRLPRMTNFTDFAIFDSMDGVSVRYVRSYRELGSPDCIMLPGTKNVDDDLIWLRESGLAASLIRFMEKKPLFALGEGAELAAHLLAFCSATVGAKMSTVRVKTNNDIPFSKSAQKEYFLTKPHRIQGCIPPLEGIFSGLSGMPFSGYSLHNAPQNDDAIIWNNGHVYGTCIHGLFDDGDISSEMVRALLQAKGITADALKPFDMQAFKESQYDILADTLRKSLDMTALYAILEEGM